MNSESVDFLLKHYLEKILESTLPPDLNQLVWNYARPVRLYLVGIKKAKDNSQSLKNLARCKTVYVLRSYSVNDIITYILFDCGIDKFIYLMCGNWQIILPTLNKKFYNILDENEKQNFYI